MMTYVHIEDGSVKIDGQTSRLTPKEAKRAADRIIFAAHLIELGAEERKFVASEHEP